MYAPGWLSRGRASLNRPLFGTVFIPPDAAVRESDFSEDEFPVYCPHCDYHLQGLPDRRCPECGEPFDRGWLLVDQYARERDHRLWRRGGPGRWATFVAASVLVVVAAYVIATHVAWWVSPVTQRIVSPNGRQVDRWVGLLQIAHEIMWWGQLVFLAALLAWVAMFVRAARRNARKRQRIIEAIA